MILPLHSSHMTQPLDVGVFTLLKKHMVAEIDPFIQTDISRIQKIEWLTAFVAAHDHAICNRNIRSRFHSIGIYPFSPVKVINHVDCRLDFKPTTRSTTPPIDPTPFNKSVLTSSSVDINAIHHTNVALAVELDSGKPLSSLAKKFIKCQEGSVERLHQENPF